MNWRYMAAVESHRYGVEVWSIREVYGKDGKSGWTASPASPVGDTREELANVLRMMLSDLDRPEYLDIDEDRVVHP